MPPYPWNPPLRRLRPALNVPSQDEKSEQWHTLWLSKQTSLLYFFSLSLYNYYILQKKSLTFITWC